jgi:hypothetical protein
MRAAEQKKTALDSCAATRRWGGLPGMLQAFGEGAR